MKKKYITAIEEILALRDTDTKIYKDDYGGYYKFIEGVPCFFGSNSTIFYNTTIDFDRVGNKLYTLIEEPVKEADENDLGALCKFWSDDPRQYTIGILGKVDEAMDVCPYCIESSYGDWYKHCRRLTPAEVAKITGYKVEE